MADGDVRAHRQRHAGVCVHDALVLYVAAVADEDGVTVGAEHGIRCDERSFGDVGAVLAERDQ